MLIYIIWWSQTLGPAITDITALFLSLCCIFPPRNLDSKRSKNYWLFKLFTLLLWVGVSESTVIWVWKFKLERLTAFCEIICASISSTNFSSDTLFLTDWPWPSTLPRNSHSYIHLWQHQVLFPSLVDIFLPCVTEMNPLCLPPTYFSFSYRIYKILMDQI